MLYVRIELWPAGDRTRAKLVAEGEIGRIAQNDDLSRGDYAVRLLRQKRYKGSPLWRTARVTDFPRTKLTAWDLLFRGLREIVGKRNKEID